MLEGQSYPAVIQLTSILPKIFCIDLGVISFYTLMRLGDMRKHCCTNMQQVESRLHLYIKIKQGLNREINNPVTLG